MFTIGELLYEERINQYFIRSEKKDNTIKIYVSTKYVEKSKLQQLQKIIWKQLNN